MLLDSISELIVRVSFFGFCRPWTKPDSQNHRSVPELTVEDAPRLPLFATSPL